MAPLPGAKNAVGSNFEHLAAIFSPDCEEAIEAASLLSSRDCASPSAANPRPQPFTWKGFEEVDQIPLEVRMGLDKCGKAHNARRGGIEAVAANDPAPNGFEHLGGLCWNETLQIGLQTLNGEFST